MWSSEVTNMIIAGIGETLYMTLVSTIAGYIIGLPMGIVLTVSDKDLPVQCCWQWETTWPGVPAGIPS